MDEPDQNKIELIERYLNNKLSDQEKTDFEAELESNARLREQLDWVRNLPDFLFSMEKERLSEQVKDWMDEKTPAEQDNIREIKKAPSSFFSRNLKIVASLAAIFLVVSLGWYIFKQGKTFDQQANEYIALYHADPVILRGEQSEAWQRAIKSSRLSAESKNTSLSQFSIEIILHTDFSSRFCFNLIG